MILDYKPKTHSIGSPILKRMSHVGLGFAAFICLIYVLSFNKTPYQISETIPIDTPLFDEPHNTPEVLPPVNHTLELPTVSISAVPAETFNEHWETVKVRKGDTLSKILRKYGISPRDVHDIVHADPSCAHLTSLHPGQEIKLRLDESDLMEINYTIEPGNELVVFRTEDGFQVEHKQQPLEHRMNFGRGSIQDSLFLSARKAGLDQRLVAQMVEIFGWTIDFSLDLQPNDTFRVLFEQKCLDGEPIQTGNILAAEIINNGKTYQAIRYTDSGGKTSYYSPDGYGMQQAFLRAPVKFSRISSHFGPRKHPILHKIRQHNGVDYAAPRGTPIRATADGKVTFKGNKGGYGRVVELQHGSRYSTLYAHMSNFAKTLKPGKHVKQGDIIGYVGSTGLATAPHLHYEFRIDGIHRNPLTVKLPKRAPIPTSHKDQFLAHAKKMIDLLDVHEYQFSVAANEFPIND